MLLSPNPRGDHFDTTLCDLQDPTWRSSCVVSELASPTPLRQAHLAHHRTHQHASHTGAWRLHFLPHVVLPPCPSESVSNVDLLRKPLLMNLFKMAFSYPSLLAFNSNFLLRIFYDLDFLFVYCSPQPPYRFNICPMEEGHLSAFICCPVSWHIAWPPSINICCWINMTVWWSLIQNINSNLTVN